MKSLLRPGTNCCTVAHASRVALLVDGDAYFRAFWHAAQRAQRSITILAWDFDSRTRLHFDPVGKDDPPVHLGDFLNHLARKRRGLRIRILNWDYPMVYGTDRETRPIYGLGWEPARRVELRYDDTHPFAGSQHQKVVVIDDAVAFAGGIDLTLKRWDEPAHRAGDPHRRVDNEAYPPVHDLMVAVDGAAARALGDLTRARWLRATGEKLHPSAAPKTDPWPEALEPDMREVDVGIARTFPESADTPAVREIERLYLDMIKAARCSLYIENQYFTSPVITEALERRLEEPDGPEVVLVLRLLSHGWLEENTMHVLRRRMLAKLHHADRHGRLRVCYPHVPGLPKGQCLDIHSKLMIVDDAILRIGSSNLCNRSMAVDTECDIVIEARGRPDIRAAIAGFRDRVLAEHLDCEAGKVAEGLKGGTMCGTVDALGGCERTLRRLEDPPQDSDLVSTLAAVADPAEPITPGFFDIGAASSGRTLARNGRGPAWGKLALIAAAIAALAALWHYSPLAEIVSAESAIGWAKDFGQRAWAPYVVALAYTPACFVLFPRPLITLAAVVAFGPWLGFTVALSGVVFSAAVTYLAGMRMRRDTVRRLAGEKLDRMVDVLRRHGLLAMTLLRLVPLAPFAIEGIVAGAVRLKLWHLLVGTAIGMLPGTLATTVFGDQIEAAFSEGRGVNWWVIAGVLAVLVAGGFAVRHWFKRMAHETDKRPRRAAGGRVAAQPR
jgi:phospholipase D1/2